MSLEQASSDDRIQVGISACLLGEQVRFDGGHKRDRFLTDTLGSYVQWVPVCPEVELGLGTPREPIRLEQTGQDVRLVYTRSKDDLTNSMKRFAKRRVEELQHAGLCGFVLKKDSPSCGLLRVKVYQQKGPAKRDGVGIFANALLAKYPNLPIEEEGRLCDPRLRENWITRLFAYRDLQSLWKPRWRIGDVVDFHTRYKFLLLAHSPAGYSRLGRMVATAKSSDRGQFRADYEQELMSSLRHIATTKKNCNVLQHLLGFISDKLDRNTREEVVAHIEDYRRSLVPLVVPLTIIRHYVRILDVTYLQKQVYLNPHPKELGLRNHV